MRSVFCMMRRAACSKSAALILCSVLLSAGTTYAQWYIRPAKPVKKLCLGFEASFGTRLFQVKSNVLAIDGMDVLEEGGSAGIVFGSNAAQVKLRQGYFYSAARVPYTTDLVETGLEVNVSPMHLAHIEFKQCEPYLLAGVSRNAVRFHGHYLDLPGSATQERGEAQVINYSRSEMPYLGTVVIARLEAGAGMAYHMKIVDSFLRFFGEVRYGYSVGGSASQQFEGTSAPHQLSFTLGTSFGWKM